MDSEHRYWYADESGERRLVGVTEALSLAGLTPTYPEGAGDFGTLVHAATVLDDEGDLDESSISERALGMVKGWRKFRKEWSFVPEMRERTIYRDDIGAAGTLDAAGVLIFQRKTCLAIVDIKTGQPCPTWAWQLAGYATLIDGLSYKRVAVQLKADGTYKLHWFDNIMADRAVFNAALLIARVKLEVLGYGKKS